MNEKEFIDWLKGFTEGVHHYNVTPAQWDLLKEQLAKVKPAETTTVTYDQTYWVTNTTY